MLLKIVYFALGVFSIMHGIGVFETGVVFNGSVRNGVIVNAGEYRSAWAALFIGFGLWVIWIVGRHR